MFIIFGLFGLIIGSFVNVLILREGVASLGGRSACPLCKRTLEWFELIPVLSWLVLRGRCRTCTARISIQYPLVELATFGLFALVGAAPITLVLKLVALPIIALLIAILVYDLYYTLIPDMWVYTFSIFALISQFFAPQPDLLTIALSGPLATLPLFTLWAISKGSWMGFGDVKLGLGMGWLLGAGSGFIAVMFAFVVGACIAVPLVALSSEKFHRALRRITPRESFLARAQGFTMQSEIPFGPFLVASCITIWLLNMYGISLPFAALSAIS